MIFWLTGLLEKHLRFQHLITAIGMSFLLESLALIIFGANPRVIDQKYIPAFLSNNNKISIGFLSISMLTIFVIVVTLICMIALNLFIKNTKLGKATRAVSQDTGAAQLMGINVNKTNCHHFCNRFRAWSFRWSFICHRLSSD